MVSEPAEQLIAAEQDERRRLALFLHDGPVQLLAGIALMLDAALHSIDTGRPEEAKQILVTALERQRQTIRDLRDLSFALEPVVLRDEGFLPALRALADHLGRSHQLRIDIEASQPPDLGETALVALYTIIRDLLEQSIRRGPPTRIEVTLAGLADGGVSVRFSDDATVERRRGSFAAIEERVRSLHGELEVAPGATGTEVRVTMPPYSAQR